MNKIPDYLNLKNKIFMLMVTIVSVIGMIALSSLEANAMQKVTPKDTIPGIDCKPPRISISWLEYDSTTGEWYYYENGEVATYYSGIYDDPIYGAWLIIGGRIAFEYSDIYYDSNLGYCKVWGGAWDVSYNDLYCSPTLGWWKISNGVIDFEYSDIYLSPTMGYWKCKGGTIDFTYTGEAVTDGITYDVTGGYAIPRALVE